MKTKYGGQINGEPFEDYITKLGKRIYKIFPMKKEKSEFLSKYISSLMMELCGGESLLIEYRMFIEILFILESLNHTEDIYMYKSQVFKCVNICNKILEDYKEGKLV